MERRLNSASGARTRAHVVSVVARALREESGEGRDGYVGDLNGLGGGAPCAAWVLPGGVHSTRGRGAKGRASVEAIRGPGIRRRVRRGGLALTLACSRRAAGYQEPMRREAGARS